MVLTNGALLVSGGRPGLGLWVSADGFGRQWENFDIPTQHNKLMAEPAMKFCDAFLNANATLGTKLFRKNSNSFKLFETFPNFNVCCLLSDLLTCLAQCSLTLVESA